MSKILDDTNPALAFVSATYETESAEKEVLDIDDKPKKKPVKKEPKKDSKKTTAKGKKDEKDKEYRTVHVGLALTPSLAKKLTKEAHRQEKSKNRLVEEIIEAYFEK